MDFGAMQNPELDVKHKVKLYPSNKAQVRSISWCQSLTMNEHR